MAPVNVVGLDVSFRRLDGGGKRVQAFLSALETTELAAEPIGVGPQGIAGAERVVVSPLHKLKRRVLPIQLRRPVETELGMVAHRGPTISLTPAANRWALLGPPVWLDFPDLWSNIARNHAHTVGAIAACTSLVQARLWSRRESQEYEKADVITTASLADKQQLGERAVWLPTPVAETDAPLKRRRESFQKCSVTYGMLANFDYPPNRDAYDRLTRQWLPRLPRVNRIVVAGFGSEKLPSAGGATAIGAVDNVADFYDQVDVVLAPIYRGGGMKVKVVEAMMHGRPVLASEHARSGLPAAIAEECVKWERATDDFVDHLSDPRNRSAVVSELELFTFASFKSTFNTLWQRRMVE